VLAHPAARAWLNKPGKAEASIFTTDPVTGVRVRVRPDWLTDDGYIVDLKSSRDSSPGEFSRSIQNYRYHVQDALYSDAYEWATGKPCAGFVFIVVESDLPHNVQVYKLDDISRHIGRTQYRANLNTYADCLSSGQWPGYSAPTAEPELISLPDWAMRIEDELELNI
jgi:exodeoxyribonuclease VIII